MRPASSSNSELAIRPSPTQRLPPPVLLSRTDRPTRDWLFAVPIHLLFALAKHLPASVLSIIMGRNQDGKQGSLAESFVSFR